MHVLALRAIRRRPDVKMMRAGRVPSPAQYATPRLDAGPPVIGYCQTSRPVSGSSATTRLPAGRYMMPFTTIGVASEFGPPAPPLPVAGPDASLWRRYVQTCVSFATLF